jgi:S1-C subfamily serine protease
VLLLALALMGPAQGHEATSTSPAVLALLATAESALARGDAEAARSAFEQAAALEHTADIETGWVRAQMQAGEYRRALAFAAHTAGAHPNDPEGASLYAWLLFLGGQETVAQQVLARAVQRLPQDALLAETRERLAPGAVHRPWPYHPEALGDPVPLHARVTGSALLLADAAHALVPLGLLEGGAAVWVRNGLGRTSRAEVLRRDEASGLAVLRLAHPLDAPVALALAPREAFPGSPGFVVGYTADAAAQPAWPRLSTGFLGLPAQGNQARRLGIDVPHGSAGAPVFDAFGRVVGVVLPAQADAQHGMASVASLRGWMAAPAETSAAPRAPDELYERALRSSLQLIRAD